MRLVGAARIEGQLGVAGHLQREGPAAAVGQGDAADLRGGVGDDGDLVPGLHVAVAAADDGLVGAQIRLVLVGVSPEGLAAGGPDAPVVQVADVAVLAPAVAGAVFPPAGHVHPLPGAVAASRRGQHDAVAAVGEEADLRGRTGNVNEVRLFRT